MEFKPGNTVRLSDGRVVYVTDVVDQSAPEVIANPDDICLGYLRGKKAFTPHRVVFYINDVVEVLN